MRNEPPSAATSAVTPAPRTWGLLLNSLIVMLGFVLSRVAGLLRDGVLNAYFGTSGIADAYGAAFNIPDMLYLVVIGGALGSAFIPVFTATRDQQSMQRAWELANGVMTLALALLAVLSLGTFVIARPLLAWIFPAFAPDQLALVTYLTRIFLLSPLLLGLGGLAMAALNATDRFLLPALAPLLYNLAIIGGIVGLGPLFAAQGWYRYPGGISHTMGMPVSIEGVAWGVVIGALLYLLLQVPGLLRAGYRPRLRWAIGDAAVRRIGVLMGPRVFGQAALQINLVVMNSLAAGLGAGYLRSLGQAYQLMLLPHGIFVLSLATVMFPQLARAFVAGDLEGLGRTMRSTLRSILWLVIPAAVGLALLSVPLVRAFFQRGAFDNASTALVSSALLGYAFALPGFAASEVLIRTFYAMQDTWTPVLVGLGTIFLNIGLCWLSIHALHLGHVALAGMFALTNTVEALLLAVLLRRRLGGLDPNGRLRSSLGRAGLGAAAMALALLGLRSVSTRWLPFVSQIDVGFSGANWLVLVAWLGGAILLGAGVYLAVAILLGAEEWLVWRERIVGRLRRRTQA